MSYFATFLPSPHRIAPGIDDQLPGIWYLLASQKSNFIECSVPPLAD
jgi:hypothetical protein